MRATMILSVVLATCFFLCAGGDAFKLPEELKWLEKHVRRDGTIKFLKGSYKLCLQHQKPAKSPECSINGEPGRCKLLRYCPTLFQQIPDENKFKELFCAAHDPCAGVCCPHS